ncbi:MAG: putative membrane protein [Oleiphilaceae bacterium]|jgi:putative membrane protein
MLWIKAFHIIAVVCWFAALFYLPRLFVYHSQTKDELGKERFKIMERKLYRGIATPSMIVTLALGVWLLSYNLQGYMQSGWFHTKLALVIGLVAYHVYCGKILKAFAHDQNQKGHVFYRWFNEFPVLLLVSIVVLVVVKPF